MKCRYSRKEIPELMTFGKMPLGNGFLKEKNPHDEYFFNMTVSVNSEIGLLQLNEQPDPERMFHQDYAFFSRSSNFMKKHFKKIAYEILGILETEFTKDDNNFVIEIGSNDGVMLEHLVRNNIKCLGIEPSLNVAKVSENYGVEVINEFISSEIAEKVITNKGKANVVYAANVFCHIPDINDLAKACSSLLKENGLLIFEDPYLGDVIEKVSYDQIYDEHVFLFSCNAINKIFNEYGLSLFDCQHISTHGGSMRYYLTKSNNVERSKSLKKQLEKEERLGLLSMESYIEFSNKCEKSRKGFKDRLTKLKLENKKIIGYGATSKSTTILNYCNVGNDLIDFIVDTTPTKHNTFTPGKHIPVLPYENFLPHPDVSVLFAWNHKKEILEKESDYKGHWMTHLYEEYI